MGGKADLSAFRELQGRFDAVREREAKQTTLAGRRACADDRSRLLKERRALVSQLSPGPSAFWATVLAAHPSVGASITTADCALLASLQHVDSEFLSLHSESFRLYFHFAETSAFDACTIEKYFCCEELIGNTVAAGVVPWRSHEKARRDGADGAYRGGSFFRWMEGVDDPLGLGLVVHTEVIPHAIELYLGAVAAWRESIEEIEFFDDDYDFP
jgi:hypothetical protein